MLATTSSPSWRRRTAACCGPSTPGATRLSTKLQRSLAKYTTTAARVPKCSSTSNASSGVRKPSSFGTIDRWADDEIGRNSVSPWTMPSTKVRSTADRSPFHVGARPGKYRSSRSIPQRVSSDLEASPGQGGGADAGPVGRDRWDQGDQQVPELGVVLLEDPDHLGARREPRALDDHHGPAVVRGDPQPLRLLEREPAQLGAVGVGEGHVRGDRAVVEGVGAPGGPVDELIADDEVAGSRLRLE